MGTQSVILFLFLNLHHFASEDDNMVRWSTENSSGSLNSTGTHYRGLGKWPFYFLQQATHLLTNLQPSAYKLSSELADPYSLHSISSPSSSALQAALSIVHLPTGGLCSPPLEMFPALS